MRLFFAQTSIFSITSGILPDIFFGKNCHFALYLQANSLPISFRTHQLERFSNSLAIFIDMLIPTVLVPFPTGFVVIFFSYLSILFLITYKLFAIF